MIRNSTLVVALLLMLATSAYAEPMPGGWHHGEPAWDGKTCTNEWCRYIASRKLPACMDNNYVEPCMSCLAPDGEDWIDGVTKRQCRRIGGTWEKSELAKKPAKKKRCEAKTQIYGCDFHDSRGRFQKDVSSFACKGLGGEWRPARNNRERGMPPLDESLGDQPKIKMRPVCEINGKRADASERECSTIGGLWRMRTIME